MTFLNIAGRPEEVERSEGGLFFIGEAGARWTVGANLAGHAAVGSWGHSGRFPQFSRDGAAPKADGTGGAYAFVDQALYVREAAAGEPEQNVGAFLQYGWADPYVSPVAQHFGGGLAASGVVPGRPDDAMGVGATFAQLGHARDVAHNVEAAVEGFYKLHLAAWSNLKLDLQYVGHPGGQQRDAVVGTVRLEVDF
jgi:carbohydrate-selective porin OprB